MRFQIIIVLCVFYALPVYSQENCYWQQEVDYTMVIDVDAEANQFSGQQTLIYTNNSPDTLHRIFYHLYFNAFQPGSMMDVRSRTILDPDKRVGDRISNLKEDEIGYQRINSLSQNGNPVKYKIEGTILEVSLAEPILPHSSATFYMDFEAQVPLQIRRSGRDSKEGIRFSMSQWYPKLSEYDASGWHPNPYIGREFYGVWGNFDVVINIDPAYMVGGTGELQDPESYNMYSSTGMVPESGSSKEWHFIARNVSDFVWAADPDYTYYSEEAANGVKMEFLYQPGPKTEAWEKLPGIMSVVFDYADEHFGKYPYDKYAIIQGGDGGMEYPLATLITGHRSLTSLVGVSVHELMHSWYQLVLGTNESLYPWMDEGFTSYASTRVMNHLRKKGLIPGEYNERPFDSNIKTYTRLVESGLEEPLNTHADHFNTNYAYGVASYTKGALFLNQMEYIVGKEVFDKALMRYFHTWKFKHPTDQDVIRIFEKESGMILDWYREYWVQSVKWIDYGIDDVSGRNDSTKIVLRRSGPMPMPVDVYVTTVDEEQIVYSIPLVMMRNAKTSDGELDLQVEKPWPWVNPEYSLEIDVPVEQISNIEIDESGRLVDVNPVNNKWSNSSRP